MKPQLAGRDWFLFLSLAGLLLLLSLLAIINREPKLGEPLFLYSQIEIEVSGAVAEPGSYKLSEGSTVGDLLRKVELLENAQTRTLKKRQKLLEGDKIEVPFRKRPAKR